MNPQVIAGFGGLAIGAILSFLFFKWWFISSFSESLTITNVECRDSNTKLRVSFSITALPDEIRYVTYKLADGAPTIGDSAPASGVNSPVTVDYDQSTCHDRVMLYAIFAADANAAIPCVLSSCSESTGGGARRTSVLP